MGFGMIKYDYKLDYLILMQIFLLPILKPNIFDKNIAEGVEARFDISNYENELSITIINEKQQKAIRFNLR